MLHLDAKTKEILDQIQRDTTIEPLEGFLIKPVQRICRYQLLLREYFKNLEEGHAEYEGVRRALAGIGDLLSVTNEMKQKVDDVDDIFQCLSAQGIRFSSSSTFLYQARTSFDVGGSIVSVPSVFERSQMNCTLFLFSDVLVVTRGSIPKLVIVEVFLFSDSIEIFTSRESVTTLEVGSRDKGRRGLFSFSSAEEKSDIFQRISDSLKAYESLNKENGGVEGVRERGEVKNEWEWSEEEEGGKGEEVEGETMIEEWVERERGDRDLGEKGESEKEKERESEKMMENMEQKEEEKQKMRKEDYEEEKEREKENVLEEENEESKKDEKKIETENGNKDEKVIDGEGEKEKEREGEKREEEESEDISISSFSFDSLLIKRTVFQDEAYSDGPLSGYPLSLSLPLSHQSR